MEVAQLDALDTALEDPAVVEASKPFVGQWNVLVSTTNWEKGRIIHEWRTALMATGVPASAYADEAWARQVGTVTGQHVGRLRRVFQRFGESHAKFSGLYWSHFQASLEWDDAEMWLEGAVQNDWTVAQMREKRWDTLGQLDLVGSASETLAEVDEDAETGQRERPDAGQRPRTAGEPAVAAPTKRGKKDTGKPQETKLRDDGAHIYSGDRPGEAISFVRPFENLGDLPEDVTDAFEAYKLVIVRHKSVGWRLVSLDDMLASLDALKELARAPSADERL